MVDYFPIVKKFVVKVKPHFELFDEAGQSLGLFRKLTTAEASLDPNAVRAKVNHLSKTFKWYKQTDRPEGDGYVSVLAV